MGGVLVSCNPEARVISRLHNSSVRQQIKNTPSGAFMNTPSTPQAVFEPDQALTLTFTVGEARLIWLALEREAREPAGFDCSHHMLKHEEFLVAFRALVLEIFPQHAEIFEPIRITNKVAPYPYPVKRPVPPNPPRPPHRCL